MAGVTSSRELMSFLTVAVGSRAAREVQLVKTNPAGTEIDMSADLLCPTAVHPAIFSGCPEVTLLTGTRKLALRGEKSKDRLREGGASSRLARLFVDKGVFA